MPAPKTAVLTALVIAVIACPLAPEARAGICDRVFRAIAHHTGFAPDDDRSVNLSADPKWQLIVKLVPGVEHISPETRDLIISHIDEISPRRIRGIVDAASRQPFWMRRAKAELFYLAGRANLDGINHVRWIERLAALEVLYGVAYPFGATAPSHLAALKAQAKNPDAEVALKAVMSAGGVAYFASPSELTVEISIVQKRRQAAREILGAALDHPVLKVRAAARRGLILLNYTDGNPVHYTDAQRADLLKPLLEIREQEKLPYAKRTIPVPEEQDGLLLARFELDRLPTHVLDEFLASRRDAFAAGPALAGNRTLAEVTRYLDHFSPEARAGAVRGLAGRFETTLPDGRNLLEEVARIASMDPNENVRLAAIEVLADLPGAGTALTGLQSSQGLTRRLRDGLDAALVANTKIHVQPTDTELISLLRSREVIPNMENLDFTHRNVAAIEAALLSGNPALHRQAVRGLKGRTDMESLLVLSHIMGIRSIGPDAHPLDYTRFSAEVRAEALSAVNLRNHPLVDRMFEIGFSYKESPIVNYMARRLTEHLARSYDNRGYLHFRTVAQRLVSDAEFHRRLRGRESMTPDETRMDDHATLLDIANNTYSLPSLNRVMKTVGPPGETRDQRIERIANKMVEERRRFLEGIAYGYQVEADMGDATTSGLKLYYLKPEDGDASKPSILSVAGTEKWLDWYSNATWGVTKRESAAYRRFLGKVVADLNAGRRVQITGHSLGGGMAQYLAYDAARAIKASLKNDALANQKLAATLSRLEIVTWNAFGVKQVLRNDKKTYDPALVEALSNRMLHYRTPFDLVSRLGEPIGPVAKLPFTGWWGVTGTHSTDNIALAGITMGGFEKAEPMQPWLQIKPVSNTLVKWLGPIGRALSERHLRKNVEEHFDILIAARAKWLKSAPDDSEVADAWLNAEIHELLTAASKIDADLTKRLGARWEKLKNTKSNPLAL